MKNSRGKNSRQKSKSSQNWPNLSNRRPTILHHIAYPAHFSPRPLLLVFRPCQKSNSIQQRYFDPSFRLEDPPSPISAISDHVVVSPSRPPTLPLPCVKFTNGHGLLHNRISTDPSTRYNCVHSLDQRRKVDSDSTSMIRERRQ